jgi:hypothetical protein
VKALFRSRAVTPSDDTRSTTASEKTTRSSEPTSPRTKEAEHTVDPEQPGGRHRRRRANRMTRTVLDEARRAGLVRRHLTKLRYLAERAERAPEPGRPAAEPPPSTSDAA